MAETAMWLTDHLMNLKLSQRFGTLYTRIPLQAQATIIHGNALRLDWNEVLPASQCSYVLGNPPFVGKSMQTAEQSADLDYACGGEVKNAGLLDLVAGWYIKAARYMQPNPALRVALVSTNSICQGEQTAVLWRPMLNKKVEIFFAHRTFKWSNEAGKNAAVHCIIVGFAHTGQISEKYIYNYDTPGGEAQKIPATQINPYLADAANVLVENRRKPLMNIPKINIGSSPVDGGYLILSKEEKAIVLNQNILFEKYIKPLVGSEELINGGERYCLWLKDSDPQHIRLSKFVLERVKLVAKFRQSRNRKQTLNAANFPILFAEIRQPVNNYLALPKVSSEQRRYLPIAFLSPEIIATDLLLVIPSATRYHFGILTSAAHMSWMRAVAGRLESRYRYSNTLVYNNFPWPQEVTDKQKQAIEAAAQAVLDARAAHPGATLADLYDPLTMPANLLKAHQKLDALVDKLYTLPANPTEAQRVARLFELYQKLTAPLLPVEKAPKRLKRHNPTNPPPKR